MYIYEDTPTQFNSWVTLNFQMTTLMVLARDHSYSINLNDKHVAYIDKNKLFTTNLENVPSR